MGEKIKKLKRRLSAAFRGGNSGSAAVSAPAHLHHVPANVQPLPVNGTGLSAPLRSWSLSDSMSRLADRLAADGVIMEECDPSANVVLRPYGGRLHNPHHHHLSHYGGLVHHEYIPHRSVSMQHPKYPRAQSIARLHAFYGPNAYETVVQETSVLGSDGESVEVSPCTSDQFPASTNGSGPGANGRYVVNVKMRPKTTRKWSEEEIQKRLSLPADLRLPLSVVEKLNRTPTLEQPLTRKSRRASLSEIGFGKLETYEKLEKLGEGTYATVFKGRSLLTNKFVALKEIRLEPEEGAPCTAIREVSLLRNLRHANVVTLHDIIHTDRLLTLVFEYVERDLKQYMDDAHNVVAISNVRLFIVQLLRGLAYCHQRRVLHRDLKPQNLLITERGELKLADFGLARAKSVPTKTYSNEVVTLWYRPPDVLLGSTDYSTHIDMWGVGCILFELTAGRALFPGATPDEQLNLIFRTLGTPDPQKHPTICKSQAFPPYATPVHRPEPLLSQAPRFDPQGYDLLQRLLQYEGRDRISAKDAMSHPFVRCLPAAVFTLKDDESVLNAEGVRLVPDPAVNNPALTKKNRGERRKSLYI